MRQNEFIQEVKHWFCGERTYTAIPERSELFHATVKELQDLLDEECTGTKVITEQPEIPIGNMFVFVDAGHVIIHNAEKLAQLLARIKNIELYSLPNRGIHFEARFSNVYEVNIQ